MCRNLNYFQHFLLSISAVTGSFSISAIASLFSISVDNTSSAVGFKMCAVLLEVNYQEKEEKAKWNNVARKAELGTIQFLLPKALIDSYINHNEFF